MAGVAGGMGGVERGEEVEIGALAGRSDASGRREIEDGRAFRAERGALKTGGEVAVAPVGRTALRVGNFGQDDEAGEVLIERAEAVVDPRAETGVTAKTVAGVHLIHRGRVIHAVHLATAVETEIVGDLGEVRPIGRHVGAALTDLVKRKRALDVVAFAAFHRGFLLSLADELLEVQARESRLGVEGVDVRRAALHHQENAVFGLGGEMTGFGCERPRGGR